MILSKSLNMSYLRPLIPQEKTEENILFQFSRVNGIILMNTSEIDDS